MRRKKLLTNSILSLIIPALAVHPQCEMPQIQIESLRDELSDQSAFWKAIADKPISFDDVAELLEEIESGSIDDCSPEELERVNQFIAILAQQGILPHETDLALGELNDDIQDLLSPRSIFDCGYVLDGEYIAVPAVFYGDQDIVLCKSWTKRAWDKTRKFVKHHKKAILIGAAIVVAVAITVTVIVMTCGTASGGVAAVASGLAGAAQFDGSDSPDSKNFSKHDQNGAPPEREQITPTMAALPEIPLLQEVIEDKSSSFRETLSESIMNGESRMAAVDSPSFLEQARNLGAYLAHETLEGVAKLTAEVPQLVQEITDLSERILPVPAQNAQYLTEPGPVELFESRVASGHQTIDKVFGTSQAASYTEEAKNLAESTQLPMTYAVLPPPMRLVSGSAILSEGRLAATQVNSTCGWGPGQAVNNRTWWGGAPKWSTVRARHWKNQAEWAKSTPDHGYGPENIPRMERGLAPQRYNRKIGQIESMELHHIPPQRAGGQFDFIELWPEEHAILDPHRRIGR